MNLKGGTAKTVTAINTAAILARDYAMRVLLVDADSQANLTELTTSGLPDDVTPGGFADLMRGTTCFPLPTKMKNVSILHADSTLMDLDLTAIRTKGLNPMALADYLAREDVAEKYDWCIIDCPPAFSAGAMAALIAADEVVIPLKLDAFGIRGLANLMEQIRNMRRINPDLEIFGVALTMFDGRTNFSTQVAQEVRKHFPGKVFGTVVPRNVRLAEAPSHGLPVTAYDRSSRGSHAYRDLAAEIIKKL